MFSLCISTFLIVSTFVVNKRNNNFHGDSTTYVVLTIITIFSR